MSKTTFRKMFTLTRVFGVILSLYPVMLVLLAQRVLTKEFSVGFDFTVALGIGVIGFAVILIIWENYWRKRAKKGEKLE